MGTRLGRPPKTAPPSFMNDSSQETHSSWGYDPRARGRARATPTVESRPSGRPTVGEIRATPLTGCGVLHPPLPLPPPVRKTLVLGFLVLKVPAGYPRPAPHTGEEEDKRSLSKKLQSGCGFLLHFGVGVGRIPLTPPFPRYGRSPLTRSLPVLPEARPGDLRGPVRTGSSVTGVSCATNPRLPSLCRRKNSREGRESGPDNPVDTRLWWPETRVSVCVRPSGL